MKSLRHPCQNFKRSEPNTPSFRTMPEILEQGNTRLDYTILYYTILYYTILYYTILYYTILYYTILYYTILYYTILYYTILYHKILYYTILYSTLLYYSDLRHISECWAPQAPLQTGRRETASRPGRDPKAGNPRNVVLMTTKTIILVGSL